jgi:hypothetical protein
MAIETAEAANPKKRPQVLSHIEIHPKLGGGHIVKHVYEGYSHDPKNVSFNAVGKSRGGEHVTAHVMKHAGLPAAADSTENETEEEEEE